MKSRQLLATVTALSASLTGGCAREAAKLSMPMVSASESTARDYVRSNIDATDIFARERDLLVRREELLINWAIKQSQEGKGAKVRAVSPSLQLTGDHAIDRARTYSITLVADELPSGETFLDAYDVVVAPDPTLAVITPATSANSLHSTDIVFAQEKLDQLRLEQSTVKADTAQASKYAETFGDQIKMALEKAGTNLTAFEAEAATATADLEKTQGSTPGHILAAIRLRQALDDSQEKLKKASIALDGANRRLGDAQSSLSDDQRIVPPDIRARLSQAETDIAKLFTKVQAAKLDDAKAKQALDAADRALLANPNDANAQANQKAAKDAQDITANALKSAKSEFENKKTEATILKKQDELRDATIAQAAATEAKAAAEASAQKATDASDKADEEVRKINIETDVTFYASRLARERKRKEHAEQRVRDARDGLARLQSLQRVEGTLLAADAWYGVMVPYWEAELQRLKDLAAATSSTASRISDRSVAVTFRGQALEKIDQIRIEVLSKRAARSTNTTTKPSDSVPGARLLDKAGNPVQEPAASIVDDLKQLDAIYADTRRVLNMTNNRIDRQSQIDWIENKTSALAPLIGRLRMAVANLDQAVIPPAARPTDLAERQRLEASVASLKDQALAGVNNALTTKGKSRIPYATLQEALDDILAISKKLPATPKDLNDEKARELVSDIDIARQIAQLLSSALQFNSRAAEQASKDDSARIVKLISNGDLALFRFNVLRGVVRSTGYLLADDNAKLLFGEEFANRFFVLQVTLRNPQDKPILIYGNTMRFTVRMNSRNPADRKEDGLPSTTAWWASVQPMDYESILRTVIQAHQDSWQQKTIRSLELAGIALGAATPFVSSIDFARGVAVFTGVATPALKEILLANLVRYRDNFEKTGLNAVEEIAAQGVLTRYVFLPKGPIYGYYAYDPSIATRIDATQDANDFSKKAMVPVYIHDVRREEVYVEGKRILASDPLSAQPER